MDAENKVSYDKRYVIYIFAFIAVCHAGLIIYFSVKINRQERELTELRAGYSVQLKITDSLRALTYDQKQTIASAAEDQETAVRKMEHKETIKYVYQKENEGVIAIDNADVNGLIRLYTGYINRADTIRPNIRDTARNRSVKP